jgi:predicted alpha/beta-fold hydrolase
MPVMILAHGMEASSSQVCTDALVRDAMTYNYTLICTQAIGGSWQFGTLPLVATENACDTNDVKYYRALFEWLEAR